MKIRLGDTNYTFNFTTSEWTMDKGQSETPFAHLEVLNTIVPQGHEFTIDAVKGIFPDVEILESGTESLGDTFDGTEGR